MLNDVLLWLYMVHCGALRRVALVGVQADKSLKGASKITVAVNGRRVKNAVARLARPDLVPNFAADPHHGFLVHLPWEIVNELK